MLVMLGVYEEMNGYISDDPRDEWRPQAKTVRLSSFIGLYYERTALITVSDQPPDTKALLYVSLTLSPDLNQITFRIGISEPSK
jgi:hypothetical protein